MVRPRDGDGGGAGAGAGAPAFTHLIADFIGVPPAQLRDRATLNGLMIAAAGAAGFSVINEAVVRQLPNDGVAGLFLLNGCHMSLHTFPDRELLLLDFLSLATHDPRKALDVFARRVTAREIRSDQRARG